MSMRLRNPHSSWDPLGVTPDGRGGANIALWAEGAEAVELCTFDDEGVERRIPITERVFNVFHGHVEHLPPGTRYGFRVYGPWQPETGQRWNPSKLLIDPYARAIEGALRLDPAIVDHIGGDDLSMNSDDSAPYVPRSVVVDYEFDWKGDAHPRTAWVDTVIYEAHVKGLTQLHPDVPAHLRGTYAGVAHPALVQHLRSLGMGQAMLFVESTNGEAIRLYESLGFTRWDTDVMYLLIPHT